MPNLFLHSINIYVADGTTDEWDFRFDGVNPDDNSGTTPYLHPDDVKVQVLHTAVDGSRVVEQRDRQLIAPNRVRVLGSQIPAGYEVRVYRETENRYPLVDYRDMQTVGSADLDLHARQTLFVAMEAIDTAFLAEQAASRAEDSAGEANVTAGNALQVAQEANVTANAANSTSNLANAAAATAVITANGARTAAEEAMAAAEEVRTLADGAATDAAVAAASALVAQDAATTAVSVAGTVDSKAQTALDNSATARQESAEALSTANGVDAKAQTALDNSSTAAANASTALSTAQGVDGKAQEALDSAAAAVNSAAAASASAAAARDRANHTGTQPANTVTGLDEVVRSTVLTGLGVSPDEAVEAQDSVLEAISKLQGQIDANRTHVLSVSWEPTRALITDGDAPLDGQALTRATFPDAWAQAQAAGLVISDAEWLADPTKRGFFSDGDGSTTFRLPDYNGKSVGSLGAVFLRGDGALSAAVAGVIQRDALQNITGRSGGYYGDNSNSGAFTGVLAGTTQFRTEIWSAIQRYYSDFDASKVARTSTETRPLNVTGCWVIKLFGAVVNVGSADAAQLASDYANLSAALSTLDSQIDFTIIYPNGGSAASPANAALNSRYVEPSPFPGYSLSVQAEFLTGGEWHTAAPLGVGGVAAGAACGQVGDSIVLRTASSNIIYNSGGGYSNSTAPGSITTGAIPCRVKVWKVKGAIV